MTETDIAGLLQVQKEYFQSGVTISVSFRVQMLKKLKQSIQNHEKEINAALVEDLGKCEYESYMCEIGMVLSELSYMIRNTKKLAAKHRVHTPLAQFASVSYTKASPYGNTLIMSPWNYPFLLTMGPLVDAVAAGNTVIIKPSAYSPATGCIIEKIITEIFQREYVAVVLGGREENRHLLEMKFDFVFFTGSQAVGKEVLRHAAEYLTPVVLELGGKSPCIVDDSAKIKLAAKRIVFGKLINCGQTCVAPDYILCQKNIKDDLVKEIICQIREQYGDAPMKKADYGRIVNRKHFDRIRHLINPEKTVFGGEVKEDTLQIAPTVMDNVTWEDDVMQQEIFGPIIPVLTFEKFKEVYEILKDKPKPLALYLFTEDKEHVNTIMEQCSFGGGCINDTIIHLATSEMGFGGVGESGMGAYHGEEGFKAFSHLKSIVDKKTWIDLPMRYRPYEDVYAKLVRFFLK